MSLMKSDRTKAPKSDRIAGYAITQMLVPDVGNSADCSADFVRVRGQRSATGSVTLSCRDGSPEPSPASPGCFLSIYLSGSPQL